MTNPAPEAGEPAPSRARRDWLEQSARAQLEHVTRTQRRAVRLGAELSKQGGVVAASAIAFDAFLSLIPLLAMAGFAVGAAGGAEEVGWWLAQLVPEGSRALVRGDLASGAQKSLDLSAGAIATLAPVSLVTFFWLSSSGVATAIGVCERLFGAEPRSYWARRGVAVAWVAVGLALLGPIALAAVGARRLLGDELGQALALGASAPLLLVVVAAFFRSAIRRPPTVKRRVFPGAALSVALWVMVTWAFGVYTTRLATYSLFYGSLAAVAILLLWLWLLAISLLVGGELNSQLEGVRTD